MNKILWVGLALIITSCKQEKTNELDGMHREIVKVYIEKALDKQFLAIEGILKPNCQEYGASIYSEAKLTSKGVISNWVGLHTKLDSLNFERVGILNISFDEGDLKGDWVVDYGYMTGVFRNEKKILVRYHNMYQFDDYKISKIYNYTNLHDIFRQAGFTIIAPKSK